LSYLLVYLGVLSFLCLCLLCGAFYPRVWPDEVLFFSPSFELYKFNILRTPVLEGLIPGMATHTLWMTPLLFYFEAFLFQFFPDTIEVVRMGSALVGIVSIFFFSEIAREMGISKKYRIFLKLLILSDFLFFKVAHSARMETLCALFSFLSMFFLVYKRLEGKKISRLRASLSGLCLGLSFLAHPFAVSYLPLILFLLYLRKEFEVKNLFWIGIGGLTSFSFWLIYLIPNWDIFIMQFGAQLGRKKELYNLFTIVYKWKVIFSEFKFPWIKTILFLIISFTVLYRVFRNGIQVELKTEFPVFIFSIFYLSNILCFLFISSEAWYVYHLIFPLALLLVSLPSERSENYGEVPLLFSGLYNIFVIMSFIYVNFFLIDMKSLTLTYYRQIETVIGKSKSIYLQAIPDPYFYFREKRPDLKLVEFIPGELPISPDYFSKTIQSFDAYVFYRKDLMNPVLVKYFSENEKDFFIDEIEIQTPKKADLELKATVFVRKENLAR